MKSGYYKSLDRDLKNSLDTARDEGKEEGRIEGQKEKAVEIARQLLAEKFPVDKISKLTGLSAEEISEL
jgi:predicted transposase/invertase (TIGR01784 family)